MNLGMAMYGGIQLVKNSPVSQNSAYYQARAAHLIADKPDKKSVEDCYYQARKPLLITDKTDKKIPDESYYHTRKLYQTPMPASDKTEEVHYMCTPLNTQLNFNSPIYEEIGRNLLSRSRNSSLKYNKPVGYTITSAQSTPGQVRSSLSCDKTLKLCDNNGDRRTYSSYKRPKPKPLPRQKPMKDQFTQSEEILSDSDENYQLVDIGSDNSTKDSSRTDGNLSLLPTPQQFQSQLLM